ncbi:hypothetical protein EDB19DRAFT_1714857 [Suillus lakei]|nr:hypothetical protein EDB19DRAFT_1714857 [Suillus lakei]
MSYSDGWEDLLRRSLYGSLAVEVNHPPVALALENMTEQRGAAENLVAVSQKAMKLGTGNFSSLSLQTIRQPCSLTAANSRRYFPGFS